MATAAQFEFTARSLQDTERLAAELAKRTSADSVLALDGDLGAGKTAFTQAFARALGVRETVNSPTFTIIKEYDDGRLPLYHLDVYRLGESGNPLSAAGALGLDEYFYGGGVTIVEWAALIQPLLPAEYLHIRLLHTEAAIEPTRTFILQPIGARYVDWCLRGKEEGWL